MPAFTLECCGDDLILKNKYGTYSKKELETQIREGHLTVGELGDIYGLKKYQMEHVLRSLSVIFRNDVNNTRIMDCSISPSCHQVLLGTLMGDAFMKGPKVYGLSHGINQVDYCYHIAEKLHPFIASFGDLNNSCINEKSFSFWTHHHDVFIPYFNRFYSRGKSKKFFIRENIADLNAEGLAYWYMDDGKYGEYGFHICVGDITDEEGVALRSILETNFGLATTFQVADEKKGYHTLYIKAESRSHFLELISPYIIPSMMYKITGDKPSKIQFSKDTIVPLHRKLCEKAGRFIRYFGDETIVSEIESTCQVKGLKEAYIEEIRRRIQNGTQISKTALRHIPTDEELKNLFLQGKTDGEIASMYGFGRNRIANLRRSMGLERKSCRITLDQESTLKDMVKKGDSIQDMMKETHLSFYKVKDWLKENSVGKSHQRIMKEKLLERDLKNLPFDPTQISIDEYVFAHEPCSDEIKDFLKSYEWLGTVGVYSKWCFTMRLRGYLAGVQILNEPASYSKMLGADTMKYECLVQRGATVSWAHKHLGSKMLMASIDWMVKNTSKRLFVGYADALAGELGTIYQACNFMYLGGNFGVTSKYIHPTYKAGKEFCQHSLRRTGVLKWWCKKNHITMDKSWFKPNGFKDLKAIPPEIKRRWYDWGNQIVKESRAVPVKPKGKYALIRGINRREQRYLESLFTLKPQPYPKRTNV